MQIDEKLITYLEELSYISLSEEEKVRLSGELRDILDGMERLTILSSDSVAEGSHLFDNVNSFRDDVAGSSFDRELILKNAPDRNDEMFRAPKTLE